MIFITVILKYLDIKRKILFFIHKNIFHPKKMREGKEEEGRTGKRGEGQR